MNLYRCTGGGSGNLDLVSMYNGAAALYDSNEAVNQLNDIVVNGESALKTVWNATATETLSFGIFTTGSNTASFTVTHDCELYFGIAGRNVSPQISNSASKYMFLTSIHLDEFNVTNPVTTYFATFNAGDVLTLNTSGSGYSGYKVAVYGKAI